MAITKSSKRVRCSVSLAVDVHRRINRLARQKSTSTSRVLEQLIGAGLVAEEAEKRRFLRTIKKLRNATDQTEIRRLQEELGRMIFGN